MKQFKILFITLTLTLAVTGCSTTQKPPQETKTTQYSIVVKQSDKVIDMKELDNFLDSVANGKTASLQIKKFTEEGDPILETFEYSKKVVRYTYDNSQDRFGGAEKGTKVTDFKNVRKEESEKGTFLILTDNSGIKSRIPVVSK